MLAFLWGLIDPISKIAGKIADYKIASQNATNLRAQIDADERAKALEVRRDALIAEAPHRLNSYTRAAFAFPFIVYNAKLVLWDKVLGLGSTDPLSPELFQVEIACIGFYFLYDIAARLKR